MQRSVAGVKTARIPAGAKLKSVGSIFRPLHRWTGRVTRGTDRNNSSRGRYTSQSYYELNVSAPDCLLRVDICYRACSLAVAAARPPSNARIFDS